MTTGRVVLITVIAGAISIGFALFGKQWLDEDGGLTLPIGLTDRGEGDGRLHRLPDYQLPNLGGQDVSIKRWAGKILVLNYWATWCPPCLREMPLFAEAQEQHGDAGLQVVGIAVDKREDVESFLADNPVNYPVLLGDTDAIELSRRLGNRMQGLPFTVVFDRTGKLVHAHAGEVTRASLDKQLSPLLAKPQGAQTTRN